MPWEIIERTDPHWSHTDFDAIDEVARTSHSAVYRLSFRRISRTGQASVSFQAIWIAICRDGQWKVQFRHNLGPS